MSNLAQCDSFRQDVDWDWGAVVRLCHRETRRVLAANDAEDAAQEAAIRAWRARDGCQDARRPEAWVRAIARNEAYRATGRRRDVPLDEASAELVSLGPPITEQLTVRAAVRDLDATDRELVVGRYWLDLSHKELANRLGMPEGTAKVRLHRVRMRLGAALMGETPSSGAVGGRWHGCGTDHDR